LLLVVLAPLAAPAGEPATQGAGQASRVVVDKDKHTHLTTLSIEKTLPVELHAQVKQQPCDPTMAIRYEQRNTVAWVEGTIENPSCAACAGEYTMAVRVRDGSGESKTLEFPGKWQRADDKPVQFTAEYPVGANVDIVNVHSKNLHCVCAASEEPASADAAPKE
jgi:hypothetical protein